MFQAYTVTTDENSLVEDYLLDRIDECHHNIWQMQTRLKAYQFALRTTPNAEKRMTVKEARELRTEILN